MEVYIATIMMFAGNYAPAGWALCNGQLLPISQYSALFSILGTSFGGDGTRTFGLPDLRGRVPMHWGTGNGLTPRDLGEMSGVENVTLLANQMPIHTHLVNASTTALANKTIPSNNLLGAATGKPDYYTDGTANVTMNPAMIGAAGGNQPFSVVQPFLGVSFIIALNGIFPPRD
ncbi:MAG: phage tail protein [Vulcanimicrobiaceae bacterium]